MAGFAALYPPYGPLGLACVLGRIEPQAKSAIRTITYSSYISKNRHPYNGNHDGTR